MNVWQPKTKRERQIEQSYKKKYKKHMKKKRPADNNDIFVNKDGYEAAYGEKDEIYGNYYDPYM